MSRSKRVTAPHPQQCLYGALGVDRTASQAEIRAAFLRKSKESHPDKGGSSDEFVGVMEAYQVLSNADLRIKHDADVQFREMVAKRERERDLREREQRMRQRERERRPSSARPAAQMASVKAYLAEDGSTYHHLRTCSRLRGAPRVVATSRPSALAGRKPCRLCTLYAPPPADRPPRPPPTPAPPPPPAYDPPPPRPSSARPYFASAEKKPSGPALLYFTLGGKCYHRVEHCFGLRTASMVLSVEQERWERTGRHEIRPCKLCCL